MAAMSTKRASIGGTSWTNSMEEEMYGSLIIKFRPEAVDVDKDKLPEMDGKADLRGERCGQLEDAIMGTRVSHLQAANNINRTNMVTVTNGLLLAKESLDFDPRSGELVAEQRYKGCETHLVEMHCWVSDNPGRKHRKLPTGTWHKWHTEELQERVGVVIEPDPAKDDLSRMKIYIVANSLMHARLALMKILEGVEAPENPWVV